MAKQAHYSEKKIVLTFMLKYIICILTNFLCITGGLGSRGITQGSGQEDER